MDSIAGRLVAWNNALVQSVDSGQQNPRDLEKVDWVTTLTASYPLIKREWTRFTDEGGRLPYIEDLILEDQGNTGAWRAGLLVHNGRPVGPLISRFSSTLDALMLIPGLRSALFSVMEAGAELPEHVGPNAGVLRYHLGVDCPDGSGLMVGDTGFEYRDGQSILFDDTVPHAGWNRGAKERVTLFCEVDRPLTGLVAITNRFVQRLIARDHRYRLAPQRAVEWDAALNHPIEVGRGTS